MDVGEGVLEEVLCVGVAAGDEVGQAQELLAPGGDEGLDARGLGPLLGHHAIGRRRPQGHDGGTGVEIPALRRTATAVTSL
ncbi:hypothetical protein [Janibacter melonis]|uniref:hypothetical protein n=1 Tax=Janibacter melonis TaxID=262209 RepID=UPI002095F8E6|nr:hypothetical protein [Janibacter melonis]